jgi:hypothetical protein
MKNCVFLDVTPRGSCKNRRFGGTYHLHYHGDKSRLTLIFSHSISSQLASAASYCQHCSQVVVSCQHPRRRYSSVSVLVLTFPSHLLLGFMDDSFPPNCAET